MSCFNYTLIAINLAEYYLVEEIQLAETGSIYTHNRLREYYHICQHPMTKRNKLVADLHKLPYICINFSTTHQKHVPFHSNVML